jgi:phosphoglycolate phosphatase-like HAD superfamily hydrolase
MGKLFVWDYHGTIEKGNDKTVIEITNRVLERNGHNERLTEDKAAEWTGRHWWEYFWQLLPESPPETFSKYEAQCVAEFNAHPELMLKYIKPNDNVHEVLNSIAQKHEQILISQVHREVLGHFIRAVGIERFFPEGRAFASLDEGNSKYQVLHSYLSGKTFDAVIAIGDSPNDMIGTINYLYAHPGRQHRKCEAHHKINNLLDILKEI